jgi:hypothetical protein
MNRGSAQFLGTISAMPCHIHEANLGPRASFAASFRSQLAWFGRKDGRRAKCGLGIWSLPATITAAVASRGPRQRFQAGAARKTDMMSRASFFLSLMYDRKNLDANAVPRPDETNPADGVGCNRRRSECDDTTAGVRKRVRASGSSGLDSSTHQKRQSFARIEKVMKMRPSEDV